MNRVFVTVFLLLIETPFACGQTLLFKSGFESDVQFGLPVPFNGQWYRFIFGTDLSTGYQWPDDFPTQDSLDAFWTYKVPDMVPLSDYVETRIERVLGHGGDSTNALFMMVKDYDPTNFDDSMQGHVRCEYRLNLDTTMTKAYIKYWMKLQPDLYTGIMRFGTGRWRMIMEWFESGPTHSDYRWSLYLRTGQRVADSNSAHWRIVRQFQNGPGNPGDFVTDTLLNHQGLAPVDEWFQVEVFWHQAPDSTGKIWVAINGNTILDLQGSNMRDSFIQNWQIFKLYTDTASMNDGFVYQWIDDVEIWDDFPFATDVEDTSPVTPASFRLLQNYPNPFNPGTVVRFVLPHAAPVRLSVFDMAGRHVRTLVIGGVSAGIQEVMWDGKDDAGQPVASGIYLYRLQAGQFSQVRKMLLLR